MRGDVARGCGAAPIGQAIEQHFYPDITVYLAYHKDLFIFVHLLFNFYHLFRFVLQLKLALLM